MPPKAIYKELEFGDGEVENAFFLADQLHKSVGEVQAMPNLEFTAWLVYFGRKAQLMKVRG